MRFLPALLVLAAAAAGCTTPPEIKLALNAKDQAYAENQRLMSEYRELVQNINERHRTWYRFVQTRLKLDLALQWATSDPKVADVPNDQVTQDDAELLGPDLVGFVNQMRLQGLPERKGPDGQSVFRAGTKTMNSLLEQLPGLVALVEEKVEKDAGQSSSADMTVFDKYQTNVQALRRMNAMIKQYLDIDMTLEPGEVQSVADTVNTLRR